MINSNNWKTNQGCLVPNLAPHESPTESREEIYREMKRRGCFFARWTTDYDRPEPSTWYHCIRDEKIYLDKLTSKQRYRVNRGLKYVDVEKINPAQHGREIYHVWRDAIMDFPETYRPQIKEYEEFAQIFENKQLEWFGAFRKETKEMCGFAKLTAQMGGGKQVSYFQQLTIHPTAMRNDVNAAMVFKIVEHYLNDTGCDYIVDGERNIRHQTNFQEWLVHNMGFRYAYCTLNVIYSTPMRIIVSCLYPFRRLIRKVSSVNPMIYNAWCVLNQEELARQSTKKK